MELVAKGGEGNDESPDDLDSSLRFGFDEVGSGGDTGSGSICRCPLGLGLRPRRRQAVLLRGRIASIPLVHAAEDAEAERQSRTDSESDVDRQFPVTPALSEGFVLEHRASWGCAAAAAPLFVVGEHLGSGAFGAAFECTKVQPHWEQQGRLCGSQHRHVRGNPLLLHESPRVAEENTSETEHDVERAAHENAASKAERFAVSEWCPRTTTGTHAHFELTQSHPTYISVGRSNASRTQPQSSSKSWPQRLWSCYEYGRTEMSRLCDSSTLWKRRVGILSILSSLTWCVVARACGRRLPTACVFLAVAEEKKLLCVRSISHGSLLAVSPMSTRAVSFTLISSQIICALMSLEFSK